MNWSRAGRASACSGWSPTAVMARSRRRNLTAPMAWSRHRRGRRSRRRCRRPRAPTLPRRPRPTNPDPRDVAADSHVRAVAPARTDFGRIAVRPPDCSRPRAALGLVRHPLPSTARHRDVRVPDERPGSLRVYRRDPCRRVRALCITIRRCSVIRKKTSSRESSSFSSRCRCASASRSPAGCRRCPDSIAGIVGGMVVPWISRSALSVTGPAAGLTSIVLRRGRRTWAASRRSSPRWSSPACCSPARRPAGRALRRAGALGGHQGHAGGDRHHHHLEAAAGGLRRDRRAHGHPGAAASGRGADRGVSLAILYGWKSTPLARFKLVSPALVVVLVASGLAALFDAVPAWRSAAAHFVECRSAARWRCSAALPRPDFAGVAQTRSVGGGADHRHRGEHRDAAVAAGGRPARPAQAPQPAGS